MILHNVHIEGLDELQHILIDHGKIISVTGHCELLNGITGHRRYEMDGAIAVPGFINSHDHLDFNLFPQLGEGHYTNYRQWGRQLHRNHKDIIQQVLKVPLSLRIQWGLYKNCMNGFTTVVNHGSLLTIDNNLIHVDQGAHVLHSPGFEKNWRWKLNNPFGRRRKVAMHIGEGIDQVATDEIDEVICWNTFRRKIVAIHGITMSERQASFFEGLVWCPASNQFLFNKTLKPSYLIDKTKLVFGTDSTLTSDWDVSVHFKSALNSGTTSEELLPMLTSTAADLWGFSDRGRLLENGYADINCYRKGDILDSNNLLLQVCKGRVNLCAHQLMVENEERYYSRINKGNRQLFIWGNLHDLVSRIQTYYPDVVVPFEYDS